MPWKGETNPYKIWLSEIILQQTRVEQGIVYYQKFISGFPSVQDLANASEKEIFKCWEGLGYYSRCRNLILTAKKIAFENKGRFPSSYSQLIQLPGIGPYTAAAIASFAFGRPHAVVDGNVERVLARYFGISTPMGSVSGKKFYSALAGELMDRTDPAAYNQAIMDFGATICKPQNPLCELCVQAKNCQAYQQGWTTKLPLKIKSLPRKTRCLYYFIVSAGKSKIWIRKRVENDIWQNLYEFVLWETGKIIPQKKLQESPFFRKYFGNQGFRIQQISPVYSQMLTHQSITGCFVHLNRPLNKLDGYQCVPIKKLDDYPFPKLIKDYIPVFSTRDSW